MSITEGAVKVETDTSRSLQSSPWDSDDGDVVETPETPVVEAGIREEPAPDASPDAVAPPTPEPEVQAITREDGATWSEKSQRWHKDGKIVAGEPPAQPKVEQAPASVTPAPVVPEPTAPPPVAEPFYVRVNGKRIDVPGLTVAPEYSDAVRGLIVDGFNHRQNFPRMQREHKDAIARAEAAGKARSDKYHNASLFLWERVEGMLKENPEALEIVRDKLDIILQRGDLQVPAAQPAAPAQPDPAQLEQSARSVLSTYLTELLEDTPGAKQFFTDEDKKELAQAFQARFQAYFVDHEGEIVLDTHAAKADFDRELKIAQRAHQVRETAARDAQKVREAAAFNAATNSTPPKPPTPARPKPVTVPSGAAKTADQLFNEAWDSDDED